MTSHARPELREKELKVKLPHRLIVKLHSVKLLQGQPIRTTLIAALDDYYRRPDVRTHVDDFDR